MRHNFVNDIGDYGKYALLRSLCASKDSVVRLGVIWYLTDHAENNGDGRRRSHLSGEGWSQLDPELLAEMRRIEDALPSSSHLRLDLIERSPILPPGTVYFSDAIPGGSSPRERALGREAWFDRAKLAVKGCNLIFLDPDNGVQVKSVPRTSRFSGKYAMVDEIAELALTGAGVIIYQHGDRTPWAVQRARVGQRIAEEIDCPLVTRTLRFGAFGVRAFFCITINSQIASVIDSGLLALSERVTDWEKRRYLLFE